MQRYNNNSRKDSLYLKCLLRLTRGGTYQAQETVGVLGDGHCARSRNVTDICPLAYATP